MPARRYGIRLIGTSACSFAVDLGNDNGALIRPVKRMRSLSNIQPGERLRLRADLTRGELGVYRNNRWCGLVQVLPFLYCLFVSFVSLPLCLSAHLSRVFLAGGCASTQLRLRIFRYIRNCRLGLNTIVPSQYAVDTAKLYLTLLKLYIDLYVCVAVPAGG